MIVDGIEEGTIVRALASALERLFFKRLLFSADMWRGLLGLFVSFSESILELLRMLGVECEGQTRDGEDVANWQRYQQEAFSCIQWEILDLVISEINSAFLIPGSIRGNLRYG